MPKARRYRVITYKVQVIEHEVVASSAKEARAAATDGRLIISHLGKIKKLLYGIKNPAGKLVWVSRRFRSE